MFHAHAGFSNTREINEEGEWATFLVNTMSRLINNKIEKAMFASEELQLKRSSLHVIE
jgi:hypothetical protein